MSSHGHRLRTELWETVSREGFSERGTFPKTNYLNKGRPRHKINLGDVGTGSASLAVTETMKNGLNKKSGAKVHIFNSPTGLLTERNK